MASRQAAVANGCLAANSTTRGLKQAIDLASPYISAQAVMRHQQTT